MEYDKTNKGIIAKNERKEKDTHPDIKGSINVGGVEYWLDGWKKERNDGSGTFYSLSVKRKEGGNSSVPPSKPKPSHDGFKARQLPKYEDADTAPF